MRFFALFKMVEFGPRASVDIVEVFGTLLLMSMPHNDKTLLHLIEIVLCFFAKLFGFIDKEECIAKRAFLNDYSLNLIEKNLFFVVREGDQSYRLKNPLVPLTFLDLAGSCSEAFFLEGNLDQSDFD